MPEKTILVVDDQLLIRFAIAEFLSEYGYNVVMAKDGADALVQLNSCTPDLVITDMTMPNLDGRALLAALLVRQPALPVILMSGDSRALDGQSVPVIQKPFQFNDLHHLVCQALEGSWDASQNDAS